MNEVLELRHELETIRLIKEVMKGMYIVLIIEGILLIAMMFKKA